MKTPEQQIKFAEENTRLTAEYVKLAEIMEQMTLPEDKDKFIEALFARKQLTDKMNSLVRDFMQPKDKVFTESEIVDMFQDDKTINAEFKSIVLCKLNATLQAMYNCVHERDKTMQMSNPYGDIWVDQHNEFVSLYQKYHD